MRPEALAKGGFYPTPDSVVHEVADFLAPVGQGRSHFPEGVRILDPCCGEGEAAALLAESLTAKRRAAGGDDWTCKAWGIELHAERAAVAKSRLHKALRSDSFATDVGRASFDALFLNPPYDYDDEARRLEHRFLQRWTPALKRGGVLVFIVPRRRLQASAAFLATHYWGIRMWTFPEDERERFDQVVLVAKRHEEPYLNRSEGERVLSFARGDEAVCPPDRLDSIAIPVSDMTEPVMFRARGLDVETAMREAYSVGWHGRPDLDDLMRPSTQTGGRVRPLMPLRQGHLAMLIAAGFLDNMVLEAPSGERVLVRGVSRKRSETIEEGSKTRHVERLEMSVLTLDFDTWEIEELRT